MEPPVGHTISEGSGTFMRQDFPEGHRLLQDGDLEGYSLAPLPA